MFPIDSLLYHKKHKKHEKTCTNPQFRRAIDGHCHAASACRKEAASPAVTPASNSTTVNEETVLTPVGYMAKSNVHFIAPGFNLNVANGHLQKIETATGKLVEDFGEVKPLESQYNLAARSVSGNLDAARVPYVSGWIAYAYWSNSGSAVTNYSTS